MTGRPAYVEVARRGRRDAVGGLPSCSRRGGPPGPAARGDAPVVGRPDDGEVALPVGAVHPHPGLLQPGQQPRRGVAVGVVGPDRDQRDARPGGGEKRRVGVGAAVVRDLQDVGAQVDAPVEDAGLRRRAQVAGEQHADPPLGDPHDRRQVVGLGGRRGDLRRRGEHLQHRRADHPPVPRPQHLPPRTGPVGGPVERGCPLLGRRERAGGDHADVPPAERAGQPADVVGVEVREQHQRQPVDAQPVQAAVHRADVGARVDEDGLPRSRRHDQRVALPDVAGDQDRLRRRPPVGHLAQRPAQEQQTQQDGERERAQPRVAPQEQAGAEEHDGEQDGAAGARRPPGRAVGQARRGPGHQHQPPHRPPGEPDQRVAHRGHQRSGQEPQQAEHRRRCHRGRGEQVGRQRHRADQAGQPGHQRGGRQPGGRGDGDRVGHGSRPAALPQVRRPAGGQQHDGRRRGHRQGEARVAGQSGVEPQQDRGRRAQRRHGSPGTAGGQGQQGDRAHRGGPDDAGLGPGEHHEAGQRERRDDRLRAAVDRPAPQRCEDPGDDDRDVGTRDGRQVGQAGPAEVLLEDGVHPGRVADDQPGQQPAGRTADDPSGRPGQPGAQVARGALHPRRPAEHLRRTPGGEPGDHALGRGGGRDRDPRADRLPGQHPGPLLRRGEQHDPGGQLSPAAAVVDLQDGRVDDRAGRSGAPHAPRVTVDLQHHLHGATRDRGQRRGGPVGAAHGRGGRRRRHRGEHREQHPGTGPAASQDEPGEEDGRDRRRGDDRGRQHRCQEGDAPDGGRDGDEPQVQPGPAALGEAAHTRTRSASSA
ncbi:hypothetical protein LY71_11871 [Geodermatophilus tzadiensis]|uniref:Uncharacterized protein n=1 Tax=Geodermatophilus tzadiensis TaxID=1137988 RepID=A0A2T0T8X4_9ACTN|nr:hypothetical protein LY71_11871 [Geodermatophilus tzadiensis]